mmetsp:Transcript_79314/g.119244  ORF Transcript_79314/g.119244 Transcript_79314/m.119244 type:complete len:311 (+) Transcript_79314:153-1085(+)|eukprot:CAMPEP_0116999384 /NCGR_PEP_ID=MMETSP0472-20121206/2107_1 /TAXON_ID=693140 ORGANISM="Tiarina fusus, Strain LIS" /NCGR_SAMPLE_ID=MMETSP0472 /ASSEMBLY_ACC=CAM_ASM_000603 /LENGTH=310 /DNA_ID=CAMNT_0004698785 /DNA_START=153 /DNA_END=1085 /DNA_ORIENTATION=-
MSSCKVVAFLFSLLLTRDEVVLAQNACPPCYGGEAPFLLEPVRPGEEGYNCTLAVERAANVVNETEACKAIQLGTYQGGCCDSPPEGYCTLCPDGGMNFTADKVIPRGAGNPQDYTCANVEERNQYVRDVTEYEMCGATPRFLSRAWCECLGVEADCNLLCDDGNPPPDLTKAEPVFGQTCERYAFEYSGLTEGKCSLSAATKALNFDAKAFCCNEVPPENCEICAPGEVLGDPEKVLQSEFYGAVTCGEVAEHAKYLPNGQCKRFINTLLDIPFGANDACCISGSVPKAFFGFAIMSSAVLFALNMFVV